MVSRRNSLKTHFLGLNFFHYRKAFLAQKSPTMGSAYGRETLSRAPGGRAEPCRARFPCSRPWAVLNVAGKASAHMEKQAQEREQHCHSSVPLGHTALGSASMGVVGMMKRDEVMASNALGKRREVVTALSSARLTLREDPAGLPGVGTVGISHGGHNRCSPGGLSTLSGALDAALCLQVSHSPAPGLRRGRHA